MVTGQVDVSGGFIHLLFCWYLVSFYTTSASWKHDYCSECILFMAALNLWKCKMHIFWQIDFRVWYFPNILDWIVLYQSAQRFTDHPYTFSFRLLLLLFF